MIAGQGQHARCDLQLRGSGRGDIGEAAIEQLGQIDLAGMAQIEGQGDVIQARVALHSRGDRQGRGVVRRAPQNSGVERGLVQIVEGRVGRGGSDDLGALGHQGVGQGQETGVDAAGDQHLQRLRLAVAQIQRGAADGEGLLAQAEFFFGDRGAHQMLEAQGGLGRMGGLRGRQIDAGGRGRRADRDDGQAAVSGCGRQELRELLGVWMAQIDDGRLDRIVGQGGGCSRQAAGRQRAPANGVEALAKRAKTIIGLSDNQNTRNQAQKQTSPGARLTVETASSRRADHSQRNRDRATALARRRWKTLPFPAGYSARDFP